MSTGGGNSKILKDKDQNLSSTKQNSHQARKPHRESPRAPSLTPTRQPQGMGFGNGHDHCTENGQQAGRRKAPVLRGKLGENFRRSLGKRDSGWGSGGLSEYANPKKRPKGNASEYPTVSRTYERSRKASRKASNYTGSSRRRLHQHNVPGTESRWIMVTSHKPSSPEQARYHPSLQDGVHTDCKRPHTSGRLASEAGHEGCIPECPNLSGASGVPEVPMARTDLEVSVPSLWSK